MHKPRFLDILPTLHSWHILNTNGFSFDFQVASLQSQAQPAVLLPGHTVPKAISSAFSKMSSLFH